MALLRWQRLPVRLRVVGSFETTEYERDAKQYAIRLKVAELVDWQGFSNDVDSELARMDLLLFPSLLAEGMPMVLLEAMAAGVPLIASRVDGVTDLIRSGIDGLLCRPGDAESLAAAITQVIRGNADWQTLRTNAHRRQCDEFSDHAMAAATAEVYRDVLSSKKREAPRSFNPELTATVSDAT